VSPAIWDRTVLSYLPPDTSDHTPPQPRPDRPVLELPAQEGWRVAMT